MSGTDNQSTFNLFDYTICVSASDKTTPGSLLSVYNCILDRRTQTQTALFRKIIFMAKNKHKTVCVKLLRNTMKGSVHPNYTQLHNMFLFFFLHSAVQDLENGSGVETPTMNCNVPGSSTTGNLHLSPSFLVCIKYKMLP